MANGTVTMEILHDDIQSILEKVTRLEVDMEELSDDLHELRPGYLEKLAQIKKGKSHHFETKESFLDFLHHEI